MITSSGSSKKRKVPLQHSMHRRVNQAYSPAEDVTLVAPPVRSRPPAPRTPSQLIALLRTCSFLGGPGNLGPGACATSSLCQDTGRPCGQPGPPPRPGAEEGFPLPFCSRPVAVLRGCCKPMARRLGLWAAWVSVCQGGAWFLQ